jgi:hypothetical protein
MTPEQIGIQMHGRLQTALHFAAQGGSSDIIAMLLDRLIGHSDIVDLVDQYDQKAILWARARGVREDVISRMENHT